VHLPKVFVQTSFAQILSLNAALIISAAEAVNQSTSTTTGYHIASPYHKDVYGSSG
jgi:hypothetical protein